MVESTHNALESKAESFVQWVLQRYPHDNGLAARLKRADNPAMEYQSWEVLARFYVNLEWESERLAFAYVAAAIVKAKVTINGELTLGQGLAACYGKEDGKKGGAENDQAKAKLRRLLACDQPAELCRIMRSMLTLIQSRVKQPLNYVRLLQQMRSYPFDRQKIRAQWVQEFYRYEAPDQAGQAGDPS